MDALSGSHDTDKMSRRLSERYPLPSSLFVATWLAEGEMVRAGGVLGDISAGGFSGWMSNPPPEGRLLHARLELDNTSGDPVCIIDADLKVCGRRHVSSRPSDEFGWVVNLATESIHPADEKLMARYIESIKAPH